MSDEQQQANEDSKVTDREDAGEETAVSTGISKRSTEGGTSEDKEAGRTFEKKKPLVLIVARQR